MTPRIRTSLVLVLGTALGLPACADEAAAKAREDAIEERLRAEGEKTRKDLDAAVQQVRTLRDEVRALREQVGGVEQRVATLETRPAAAGAAPAAVESGAAAGTSAADKASALREEMKRLQEKVFNGEATEEEQERFWQLAASTELLDGVMKTLETQVKDRPDDLGAKMRLADAYVAKLLTVPPGPLQGVWGNKAMQQWQSVLEKQPDHWDARYSVAFSWSMWPDFLNKTPDAVREFEKLREVQERQTVDAKHAQTYFQLSRLYQKQGKTDKARETLRAGVARHPDDAELKKALAAMEE